MAKDPDHDWLGALAGNPSAEADPKDVRSASLLRDAIKRHDSALGADEFDIEAGLQKLKFRIRREGLDSECKQEHDQDQWDVPVAMRRARSEGPVESEEALNRLQYSENLPSERKPAHGYNRFARYAIAASLVLTVGLTIRLYLHEQPLQNEADIMRGSQQQIVIAEDPEARLKQLTTDLGTLGISYQIERKNTKLILKAKGVDPAKNEVADFLERNHITSPVGTDIELDIRPLAKP